MSSAKELDRRRERRHRRRRERPAKRLRNVSMSGSYTSGDSSPDEERGRFDWKEGYYIRNRYCIHKELGKGTFGLVLECWDKKRSRVVAVKVVRAIKRYVESAATEASILTQVNDTSNRDRPTHVIEMFKCFEWRRHFCIVFEKLGGSLFQVLEENDYQPFEMHVICDVARQLLQSLKFLHEECRLIHTDLKLENILLVDSRTEVQTSPSSPERVHPVLSVPYKRLLSTEIKLIDFGGATYDNMHKSAIINTRQYRGPEVILDLGWSYPSDIWSSGCVLMELYMGDLLFKAHEEAEHLAMMERVCGSFPSHMCRNPDLFRRDGRVRLPSYEMASKIREMPRLGDLFPPKDDDLFFLIQGLLRLDPKDRYRARDGLNCRFLQ